MSTDRSSGDPEQRPGDEAPSDEPAAAENLCHECQGTGRVGDEPCSNCSGTGWVTEAIGG